MRVAHGRTRHEPGGAGRGQDAANQMDVTGDRARLGDVQAVGAQQKCRGPPDEAPSPQRTDAARHDDVERGSLTPQERQRLRERGLAGADDGVEPSTRGLAEGEKDERAEQHARHAQGQECPTPAVGLCDGTRHVRGEPGADGCAQSEDAQGHGTPLGGKAVRHDRRRGWSCPRLAHARADPTDEKLPVGQGQTTEHREARPQHQGRSHDVPAIGAVGEPGDGNSADDVE